MLTRSAVRSGPLAVQLAAILLSLSVGAYALQADPAPSDPAAGDIESGIQLFQHGNLTAAKLKFSAAVTANPRSADALTWRGITENRLEEYTVAAQDFEAALSIDANEMSAHYNLALTLIRMGKTDSAIEQLLIVTKAHPGVVEPEYNLGVLLEEKKVYGDAAEHLQAAYRAQPNDGGVAQHLLLDLLMLGKVDEAQPILEQMRATASPEMWQQMGAALIQAGQFASAIFMLEKAPDQAHPHETSLLLARAYIGAGEHNKAIALLEPQESTDRTGEAAYLLGLAYSGSGDLSKAKIAFQRAVSANPRAGLALYHLGLIEFPQQPADAVRRLREAVRLEPRNPIYALALSRILLQQDHAQKALALLKGAVAEGPEAAERNLLLGIAQLSLGDASQAVPTLEQSVKENPSLPLSRNILGFCYFQRGDYAKAAEFYRQASDIRPEVGIFAHDAAIAFERTGEMSEATAYASKAVALPEATGDDHYLMGKLFAKAGRKDEAIGELKEAVALSPELDAAYYLLARTYLQMGDTTQANEWNAKLTELKQKHDRAYAAAKNAKAVTSSTLLNGAPMNSAETDEH
jgi:tetratricopeptide (TPR) repeat protein